MRFAAIFGLVSRIPATERRRQDHGADAQGRLDGLEVGRAGPAGELPVLSPGYLPARTHGWDATMAEYDRKSEVYEYGYQVGHRAFFSLRPGESLVARPAIAACTSTWTSIPTGTASRPVPQRTTWSTSRSSSPAIAAALSPMVFTATPPTSTGDLALGAEVYDNLASARRIAASRQAGGQAGGCGDSHGLSLYLSGRQAQAERLGRSADDRLTVSISTNNGRSFAELAETALDGARELTIDLKERIFRRYAYWIKLELTGRRGLERLEVENDIQHAPRTLPWLGNGSNTITVAADRDPTIATRSITCRITPDATFTKNETSSTMGLGFENVDLRNDACWWKGGTGLMTVPVDVPGDLVSLGSRQIRPKRKRPLRMDASTDGGRTWRRSP